MDLSIFGSEPPTQPPNMEKNKRWMVSGGSGGGWHQWWLPVLEGKVGVSGGWQQ